MATQIPRGLLEATERNLSVLLADPGFKDDLRAIISAIDPEGAPAIVRTILWRDPEVVLGILGALPEIINALVNAADELVVQVREKFTPELLESFVGSILNDVDSERIAHLIAEARPLLDLLLPLLREALSVTTTDNQPLKEVQ